MVYPSPYGDEWQRGLFPGFPGGPGGGPGAFPGGGPGGSPGGFPPPPPGPGGGPGGFPPPPPPGPGGPGGFPPPPGPGGGPGGGPPVGAPSSPPPSFTPTQSPSLQAVNPGSLRGCLYRYVYIWQTNRESYWMYLTFVGPQSLAGYRWFGFGPYGYWIYFGLDLRRVQQFFCY